jgi:hypothetical protein
VCIVHTTTTTTITTTTTRTNHTYITMSDAEGITNQEVPETNIDAEKEDRLAEESEATGVVSKGGFTTKQG